MHHTVAYRASQAAAAVNASLGLLFGPGDNVAVNVNQYFAPRSCSIAGVHAFGANATGFRVNTPAIYEVGPVELRPFVVGTALGSNPAYDDLGDRPIRVRQADPLDFQSSNNAGGAVVHWVIAHLMFEFRPKPAGQRYRIRGTGTTTLTAAAWTVCQINWGTALPAGRYAVIGMEAQSATCVAARLDARDTDLKPGVHGIVQLADRMSDKFMMQDLGTYVEFNTLAPPNVQFLATAADTAQTVFLDLIRLA